MNVRECQIKIPYQMSEHAYNFFKDVGQLLLFIFSSTYHSVNAAETIQLIEAHLRKEVSQQTIDKKQDANQKPRDENYDLLLKHFESGDIFNQYHKRMLMEIVYCRIFDNYIVYLSDTLGSIFISEPNTLKSLEINLYRQKILSIMLILKMS